MPFVFSSSIGEMNYHIRLSPNLVQKGSLQNEMPHKHFFLEFHYVYSGVETLEFSKGEEPLILNEGSFAIIPYAVYHRAVTKVGEEAERLCFNFSMDGPAGKENPWEELLKEITRPVVLKNDSLSRLMLSCRDLLREEEDPVRDEREGILLLHVTMEAIRAVTRTRPASEHAPKTRLRQKWIIEEYIWNRYHSPQGLKGLADELFLSQRQTRKLVQQFFGEDYKTLIIRQRMEMAQLLLQSEENSLEEISRKVGYQSYSGFHLAFVRSFGISPGEYRKREKKST